MEEFFAAQNRNARFQTELSKNVVLAKHNKQLEEFKRPNIVAFVKSKRMQQFGNIWRAERSDMKVKLSKKFKQEKPCKRPRQRYGNEEYTNHR